MNEYILYYDFEVPFPGQSMSDLKMVLKFHKMNYEGLSFKLIYNLWCFLKRKKTFCDKGQM